MERYKEEFIELLVTSGALKFGDFALKSGRQCPYFLNIGQFYKAESAVRLFDYYAQGLGEKIREEFEVIFGPAYKGIPLCVGVATAYYLRFKRDVGFSFNRKEAKDHGEGGMLVGSPITKDSRVVIVDDVMTAGTALHESVELLQRLGSPRIVGVLIAVDRMEKGRGQNSATAEVKAEFGIDVYSIVTIEEIVSYLLSRPIGGKVYLDDAKQAAIENYRKQYGA